MGHSRNMFPSNEDHGSMRIDGSWLLCDDGIVRPIVRADVDAAEGRRVPVVFLADCGADRTVFSAETLAKLGLASSVANTQLAGVGGQASTVLVSTKIHLLL